MKKTNSCLDTYAHRAIFECDMLVHFKTERKGSYYMCVDGCMNLEYLNNVSARYPNLQFIIGSSGTPHQDMLYIHRDGNGVKDLRPSKLCYSGSDQKNFNESWLLEVVDDVSEGPQCTMMHCTRVASHEYDGICAFCYSTVVEAPKPQVVCSIQDCDTLIDAGKTRCGLCQERFDSFLCEASAKCPNESLQGSNKCGAHSLPECSEPLCTARIPNRDQYKCDAHWKQPFRPVHPLMNCARCEKSFDIIGVPSLNLMVRFCLECLPPLPELSLPPLVPSRPTTPPPQQTMDDPPMAPRKRRKPFHLSEMSTLPPTRLGFSLRRSRRARSGRTHFGDGYHFTAFK